MEDHTCALGQRDPARVGGSLPGEDAEERRLARAVTARERKATVPFQPERDILKKLALTDELGEAGGLDDSHADYLLRSRGETRTGADGPLFRPERLRPALRL